MADLISMLSAASGATAEADPNFKQTVLLLHGDGTNGAQNNTFLDSSTNNFTITRNGNTTQGTFSPFSLAAGEWSNFFDGTGDYFEIPDNVALRPETSNFTIEAWVYRAVAGVAHTIFAKGSPTGPTGFFFTIATTNTLQFTDISTNINSTGTISVGVWTHVAVVREGTGTDQLKLYINGVQDGQGTVSTNFNQTNVARIGANRASVSFFNGYISNFRFVKGTAVYTSNFTPSTTPLTAITNTSLLTCQSNRFVDKSTNNFTLNRFGDVRVTPFSPFAPTAAYSAGTNGGSGYFGGDGNYISAPYNAAFDFSTGDFTVECFAWVIDAGRSNDSNKYGTFISGGANLSTTNLWSTALLITSGVISSLQIDVNGSSVLTVSGQSIPLNAWHHFVFCRTGTTLSIFVNGSRVGTTTYSSAINTNSGGTVQIARSAYGGLFQNWFSGYIANARIIKGSGPYDATQTTLTVPTAPLTNITNTSLLCNFTNAGIIDNTGKNNLETVGNAQIDTTTKKYGTGSLEFDGTGDWLLMPNNPNLEMGSGNFTIEMWVYPSTTGTVLHIFGQAGSSTASTQSIVMYKSATEKLVSYTTTGSTQFICTSTGNLTQNQWSHVAFVRNGSTLTQYINGTADGTASVSTNAVNLQTTPFAVGQVGSLSTNGFNGYIDDLRITKGVARYTANFTAPTKAFPDQ